jgi:hypothetical protein
MKTARSVHFALKLIFFSVTSPDFSLKNATLFSPDRQCLAILPGKADRANNLKCPANKK